MRNKKMKYEYDCVDGVYEPKQPTQEELETYNKELEEGYKKEWENDQKRKEEQAKIRERRNQLISDEDYHGE